MEKSLVSIIIPTYNAAAYITDAIDSVLAQTYVNKEIIVVDDGSIDNTREVLSRYLITGKIKYIFQENKGLSGARNTGIKESRGKYIALLDADDFFLPEKIEKQVEYLELHPDCDISYCDLYHFHEDKPEDLLKLHYKYYAGDDVLPHLIVGNFIAPLAVVLRKSLFERFGYFDETMRRSEDIEFWIRVAYGGGKICFLPEILGKLRMRKSGNLQDSKSQSAVKITNLEVLDRLANKMNKNEKKAYKLDYYRAIYAFKTSAAYLLNGDKKNAHLFAKRALRYYPFSFLFFIFFDLGIIICPPIFFPFVFKVYYNIKHLLVFKKIRRT